MKLRLHFLILICILLLSLLACSSKEVGLPKYGLTVSLSGQGTVMPFDGHYVSGTLITFNVRANEGWKFSHWLGDNRFDVEENQGNWQINMTGPKILTAVFLEDDNILPEPKEEWELKVTCLGEGKVYPPNGYFGDNEIITFDIRPEMGWLFDRWEGPNKHDLLDGHGKTSYRLEMNSDKNLLAIFRSNTNTLLINTVGQGCVEEKLMGSEYPIGTIIKLTAIPDYGWEFREWQGNDTGTEEIILIELDSDKEMTAIFAEIKHNLTIFVKGKGSIIKSPNKDKFDDGEKVTLIAKPDQGWAFLEWDGDAHSQKERLELVMEKDTYITAIFREKEKEEQHSFEIKVEGGGRVTKKPNREYYQNGERVVLNAYANDGWEFQGWLGDAIGSDPEISVIVYKDTVVTAVFSKIKKRYSLNIEIQGQGQVLKTPAEDDYEEETEVGLKAEPACGWQFSGWSGDLSGNNSNASVVMNTHKHVLAIFTEEEKTYPVDLSATDPAGGQLFKVPDKDGYEKGEAVTISATITPRYAFYYWMINGTKNYGKGDYYTVTITVDGPVNAIATIRYTG